MVGGGGRAECPTLCGWDGRLNRSVCVCVCAVFVGVEEAFCVKLLTSSGASRIMLKRGQNRDFGKKEGAKKNKFACELSIPRGGASAPLRPPPPPPPPQIRP